MEVDNTFIVRLTSKKAKEDVIIVQSSSNAISTGNIGNKSKAAAGLLGIFLGSLAVHNSYFDYWRFNRNSILVS